MIPAFLCVLNIHCTEYTHILNVMLSIVSDLYVFTRCTSVSTVCVDECDVYCESELSIVFGLVTDGVDLFTTHCRAGHIHGY